MKHPTGRECTEITCRFWRNGTEMCGSNGGNWATCPRAIRWRLAEAERLGDALAEAAQSDWDCTDDRGDDAMRIAARLHIALTAWRARAK